MSRTGGVDVMQYQQVSLPAPEAGQVQLKQHACGINFIDVYFRTGLYQQPLPGGLGLEAAGIVTQVGEGVETLKPGDRVAYVGGKPGAYASLRNLPASQLIKLPDDISFETAAAVMLKGLTVHYLFHSTFKLERGHTILFHAAAGGVGLLACQWARHIGATMIGTAGSPEKAALARRFGCAHVIEYRRENFVERVKQLTDGKGVDVVYDAVGKDTWPASLDCLKPRGLMVSFGNASGPVPAVQPLDLTQRGSLFFTRPALAAYIANPQEYQQRSNDLFNLIRQGVLKVEIGATFSLTDVAKAHQALESRSSSASMILIP